MRKFIRKADIILLLFLIAVGAGVSAVIAMQQVAADEAKVIIKSGGNLYASYSLSEDKTVKVPSPENDEEYNIVAIKDGKVSVSEASCKNQVCVRHGSISQPGESIVCLPNRLVVAIDNEKEGRGYDSVTS